MAGKKFSGLKSINYANPDELSLALKYIEQLKNTMRKPIVIRGFHGGNIDGASAWTLDEGELNDATIYRALTITPLKFDEETVKAWKSIENDVVAKAILLAVVINADAFGSPIDSAYGEVFREGGGRNAFLLVIEADELIEIVNKAKELIDKKEVKSGDDGKFIDPSDAEIMAYKLDVIQPKYDVGKELLMRSALALIWTYDAIPVIDVFASDISVVDIMIKHAKTIDAELAKYIDEYASNHLMQRWVDDFIAVPYDAMAMPLLYVAVLIEIVKRISAVLEEHERVAVYEFGTPVFADADDFATSRLRKALAIGLKRLLAGPFIRKSEQMKKLDEIIREWLMTHRDELKEAFRKGIEKMRRECGEKCVKGW